MSDIPAPDRLRLPDSLQSQLRDFRRRVWAVKLAEAAGAAVCGVLAALLALFVLDRGLDTPDWLRGLLFVAALLACACVPLAVHRWVWRQRYWEQLARLLGRSQPAIGDQLLGIIELVRNDFEQARSRTLCEAAIKQVAEAAQVRDFRGAVPRPRHRRWGLLAGAAAVLVLGLWALFPAAMSNSWARLLAPWRSVPRYTFAAIEPLPDQLTVAHGEPFTVTAQLAEGSRSQPADGTVRLGQQSPIVASLDEGRYEFALPPQIAAGWLDMRIGDWRHRLWIEPTLRPELTSILADVTLPAYLERPDRQRKDIRGGAITLVHGSRARFVATASRPLAKAYVAGRPQQPAGPTMTSPAVEVPGPGAVEFRWEDELGLAGKSPFTLAIHGREDEPPSLFCEDLPRQKVVYEAEQLSFQITARDDFGVKRVGLEWRGAPGPDVKTPALGERMLAAGGGDRETLEVRGTFSARSLGIEPQLVQVRLFAEDYYPGRERVYSPPYQLYVLSAEQHAIWLTEQLHKWHRQSLEVRDRELQLHETNKQLRALTPAELDEPEARRRIQTQAAAERANGQRLSHLVGSGEDLVRQATRNPEFGVGHLEKWAERLQILKEIAANRMPSVAELLAQAAQAPPATSAQASQPPGVGKVHPSPSSKSGGQSAEKPPPAVPQLALQESTHQPQKKSEAPPADSPSSKPRFGLPQTTLLGGGPRDNQACPAGPKLDEAVAQQQQLLTEFEKIADELNELLANLEGSTLVKRLKAASRLQYRLAGQLGAQVTNAFGLALGPSGDESSKALREVAGDEAKATLNVSHIMDDMQAYFERRRLLRFKSVLEEMRQQDVLGSLRQIGEDVPRETGMSIAQCEYWSDTLDRWAEDLVDPTSGGT